MDVTWAPSGGRLHSMLDRVRKRVGELTVNVLVAPELKCHENGGETRWRKYRLKDSLGHREDDGR